jgi:hypothetical protein
MLLCPQRTATATHPMGKMSHGHMNISFLNQIASQSFYTDILDTLSKFHAKLTFFIEKKWAWSLAEN